MRTQKRVMVWWYFSGRPTEAAKARRAAAIRAAASSTPGDSSRQARASRRWEACPNSDAGTSPRSKARR